MTEPEKSEKPETASDAPKPSVKDLLWSVLIQIVLIGVMLLLLSTLL